MLTPFSELTTAQATALARDCKHGAHSPEEVKARLRAAGFPGTSSVAMDQDPTGRMRMFMILAWGPRGEIISA